MKDSLKEKKTKDKQKNKSNFLSSEDEKLLKEQVDAVDRWYTYSNDHLQRARDLLTFLYVDQWDIDVRKAREAVGKPCMQFNKLVAINRSILGEQRENSPQFAVRGVGKNIQQEKVDVVDGLLRQISYSSDSDIVFQVAFKQMLECGWGAARICTRYESPESFNQEEYLEPIDDIQTAFWDETAKSIDKSDGDGCGVYTTISKEHFKRIYPHIEHPLSADSSGGYFFNWYTTDTVTMCERYYKEYYTKEVVQFSDDNIVEKSEANEILEKQRVFLESNQEWEYLGFKPLEIVNEKTVQDYKIKYIKFIKDCILEKKDYAGKILPIPYFMGDYVVIDGERIPLPFISDAIDNQKLANYLGSELAYAVLIARKETVIGTPDNFKGYEDDWRNRDQVQAFLRANPGRGGEMPQFITPPAFNRDLVELFNNNNMDLKQNVGYMDEAMGNATNADSGLAISRRQQASKKPVNVYNDNLARGIRQCGKVILDLMPHIYDSERTINILGKDGSSKSVDINKKNGYSFSEDGEIENRIENNMAEGDYDLQVQVDGSYDAQMEQAMNMLLKLASVDPRVASMIPDLLAENSGLKNTQKLVARLKTLLPPEILAEEEGKPMPEPQQPPPNPMIEIEKGKIQLGFAENETKKQQQILDEQKLMLEAEMAGLEREATFAKAEAEVTKSHTDKDIALINHGSKMVEHHAKSLQHNR